MQTLVRKANEEDVAAVLPLWRELMEFHSALDARFRLVSDAASQVEAHLRAELTSPTSLLAVAEYDASVAAYCRASVRQQSPIFEHRAHGFISELHVSPAFRRRGIGRSLLQFVRRWFEEQEVARIELVTLDANDSSNAFWRTLGCKPYAVHRRLELTGV